MPAKKGAKRFDPAVIAEAVERVAAGETKRSVAKSLGTNENSVVRWVGLAKARGTFVRSLAKTDVQLELERVLRINAALRRALRALLEEQER